MKSVLAEATNWIGGSRYGKTYKDKIVLFLYILSAVIVIIFVISVFGKSKVIDIYFKRTYESHSMSTMCKEFLTSVSNSIITYKEELIKKTVRTVTIDSLVETHNVSEISLLKIDVEGSEVSALKGAIDTLYKKKVRNMLIEYHSSENYDYIVRMLEELGYKVATSQ